MTDFGPLEEAVMNVIWDAGEAITVRAVTDALAERRLAYTTTSTVLQNLQRKGWLERERTGRVWFYRAVVSRSDYAAGVMRDALHESGRTHSTLLRFVDGMTEDEAATLRDLLDQSQQGEQA